MSLFFLFEDMDSLIGRIKISQGPFCRHSGAPESIEMCHIQFAFCILHCWKRRSLYLYNHLGPRNSPHLLMNSHQKMQSSLRDTINISKVLNLFHGLQKETKVNHNSKEG